MGKIAVDEWALVDDLAAELGVASPEGRVARLASSAGAHRISALRWGTGPRPVVFLHGGSLNAHAWDALALLDPGLEALALDLPGHGHSGWFDDPVYLPPDVALAISPALQELTPSPMTIVGHSLGGLAALALAATRPELVHRLVLVDATPGSTPERSRELVDFVSARDFGSFEEMLDHTAAFKPSRDRESLRRSLLLNTRQTDDGRWTWRHDSREREGRDRWDLTFEQMPEGWHFAAALQCPTLLVRGARSRIMPPADVERYRSLVADLRVVEIPDAGHNVHGEQPAALGSAIATFLHETRS